MRIALVVLAVLLAAGGVHAQPVTADFAAVPLSGVEPLTVQFVNLSSGDVLTHAWSFGDGQVSYEFEPVHVYEQAGSYTVGLLAIGDGFEIDSETKADYIEVQAKPLSPQIEAAPTTGTLPLAVTFADADPLGPAEAWLWDFGDGNTSTQAAPTHVYLVPGTYDVSLTTWAGSSTGQVTEPGLVTVLAPTLMQPAFTAAPRSGSAPIEVAFAYAGTGLEPDAFHWDFGDGVVSDERDPVHLFATPGSYDVTLTTSLGDVDELRFEPTFVEAGASALAFGETVLYADPAGSVPFAVVDVTGDGLGDVLAAGTHLVTWPGVGGAALGAPLLSPTEPELIPWNVHVGDLDGDGDVDVVGRTDATIDSYIGDGAGGFAPASSFAVPWEHAGGSPVWTPLALGDFTGDGVLDLLAGHQEWVSVYPGDGAGGWLAPLPDQALGATIVGWQDLHVADLDGDGRQDLRVSVSDAGLVTSSVLLGDGAGGFVLACQPTLPDPVDQMAVAVGDVTGDGAPDVVRLLWGAPACSDSLDALTQTHVDGLAGLCADWTPCAGTVSSLDSAFVIDAFVDLDGLWGPDLIGRNPDHHYPNVPHVVLSAGGGRFGDLLLVPGGQPADVVGDLDGDGLPELVWEEGLFLAVRRNLTPLPGWADVGGGLAGSSGAPQLDGSGAALPDELVRLDVSGAAPFAPTVLVLGLSEASLPFQGGTLVPSPDVFAFLVTDEHGQASAFDRWPATLGPGFSTWWQAWVADAGGPGGFAATNALRHRMPSP